MMSLWDALRMNMMISYQELVRTFPKSSVAPVDGLARRVRIRTIFIIMTNANLLMI